jgi:micrococcal nuclease
MMALLASVVMHGCVVTDGDTIRCGTERVRLLAIQAPDKPEAAGCRRRDPAYVCNRLLAAASTGHLRRLASGHPLRVVRVRRGAWGRTDAVVYREGDELSLNCRQIRAGRATYWARYDVRGMVARECGVR